MIQVVTGEEDGGDRRDGCDRNRWNNEVYFGLRLILEFDGFGLDLMWN